MPPLPFPYTRRAYPENEYRGLEPRIENLVNESKYVRPAREDGKLILSGSMQLWGDNPRGLQAASAVFGGLTLAGLFLLAELLLNDPALAATAVEQS